ncbi:MAG: DUF721 domain-containing protein [Sphaerospermopsis sp. SIO1G2]|nr:DUF721 domain-containing protein [Sphaerospermopsis sp. SIO1G1]NET70970.1 DUF721 domain-containing protein [Sphaerospermopsis sp. SIO1G2]
MPLKSVNDILDILAIETKPELQPLLKLLKYWPELVGTKIALHTRPLSIQRGILRVATSSAAWSQNLTFQRRSLLLKLNKILPQPLVDIHFSTAEWRRLPLSKDQQQTLSLQEHPSYLGEDILESSVPTDRENINTFFTMWIKKKQEQSQHLSSCPQCKCPTPPGEIQYWGVCYLCRAKSLGASQK